jgi:small neutral amino acid transporter SnatA (MarC family)
VIQQIGTHRKSNERNRGNVVSEALSGQQMIRFLLSAALLLVLLNPFLVIVYLADIVQKLERTQFINVLSRAGLIAGGAFCGFAVVGDTVFSHVLQADFASFQIFGGIMFLIIGLQFVFRGPQAIEILRGESEHIARAIAMPVLIGPGTISASVIIGERHNALVACAVVLAAVTTSVAFLIGLKLVHDLVRSQREHLIQRYIEIAGRVTALFVGTVSIEMTMQGFVSWSAKFQ